VEGQKLDMIYWSNRIAMLASSQFPIVTALGTKNNIVSRRWKSYESDVLLSFFALVVTGISYDRVCPLIIFHRALTHGCEAQLYSSNDG
jgi:ferric-chelate reductase